MTFLIYSAFEASLKCTHTIYIGRRLIGDFCHFVHAEVQRQIIKLVTHFQPLHKMAAISQMAFSDALFWICFIS